MFRRIFQSMMPTSNKTLLTGVALTSAISVAGLVYSQQAGIRTLWVDGNNHDYTEYGLPHFDRQPTANDIRSIGQNEEQMGTLAEAVAQPAETHLVVSNTNTKDGHYYFYNSKTYSLTQPEHVEALGYNMMRLMAAMFPNGGYEVSPEISKRISDGYASQLQGKASGTDLLKGVDISAYPRQNWNAKTPITTSIRLGLFSFINVSNHKITQRGDLLIHTFTADTTHIHIFDGTAIWMLVVNTKTGDANFAVVGAGQHPLLRSIDDMNNMLVGTLWTTVGESSINVLNHYGEQAVTGSDAFLDTLTDPNRMRDALDRVSPETRNRRSFLTLTDGASGLFIAIQSLFARLSENQKPPTASPEQLSAVQGVLDTITPDEQAFSEDDLQELLRDEQSDPSPDATNPDGETGAPDATNPDRETGAPDATNPDRETGAPDETNPDGEMGTPDETNPDGETGTHEGPGPHEPVTGHGE